MAATFSTPSHPHHPSIGERQSILQSQPHDSPNRQQPLRQFFQMQEVLQQTDRAQCSLTSWQHAGTIRVNQRGRWQYSSLKSGDRISDKKPLFIVYNTLKRDPLFIDKGLLIDLSAPAFEQFSMLWREISAFHSSTIFIATQDGVLTSAFANDLSTG